MVKNNIEVEAKVKFIEQGEIKLIGSDGYVKKVAKKICQCDNINERAVKRA